MVYLRPAPRMMNVSSVSQRFRQVLLTGRTLCFFLFAAKYYFPVMDPALAQVKVRGPVKK